MKKPLWFALIEQWKIKRMGNYGITLPFLVGAIAHTARTIPSENYIHSLLKDIAENPFPGYVIEVRWCPHLDAPVFSVSKPHKMPYKSQFTTPTGEVSLGFWHDIHTEYALGCNNSHDCLEKLEEHAKGPVGRKCYSLVRNPVSGEMEFSAFLSDEIRFIERVWMDRKVVNQ